MIYHIGKNHGLILREGLSEGENGDIELKLEDIKLDSEKVRPYDYVWDMYYDEFEDYVEGDEY